MPPPRIRNPFDDSRSEASSTREKQPHHFASGISKPRRNGASGSALKDVTNAAQSTNEERGSQDAVASVSIAYWLNKNFRMRFDPLLAK
ncbi:hypothetical protein P7C71_g5851, partial [Lecanoromycetidae sp. Uapishka_2]